MSNEPAHDDRSYPDRPFVGVGVVVWKGPKVLLVQRGKAPRMGQWSIPGGIQHVGETVFEAARREVMEEASLTIEVIDTVAVVDSIVRDEAERVRYHYTLVDVVARWLSGEARAGDDAADVAWAGIEELGPYELWTETTRVISEAALRIGH